MPRRGFLVPPGTPYFLSGSPFVSHKTRALRLTSPQLALSPSLHSHNDIIGNCGQVSLEVVAPQKFNQLDRRKTFLPSDLTGEQRQQPRALLLDRVALRMCAYVCLYRWITWRTHMSQSRSSASHARTRFALHPRERLRNTNEAPTLIKSRAGAVTGEDSIPALALYLAARYSVIPNRGTSTWRGRA